MTAVLCMCGHPQSEHRLTCPCGCNAFHRRTELAAITLTLPDGTTHRVIEVEVETRFEGPGHMGTDVPYVCPVDWRDGYEDIKPSTVRLFALVDNGRSGDPR